ncbi:MAG: hypothetical protein ACR2NZ_18785 [Rubripirellula sp.]
MSAFLIPCPEPRHHRSAPVMQWGRVLAITLLAGITIVPNATGKESDSPKSLSASLRSAATDVIQHCQDQKYEDIGVLRFLVVKKGDQNEKESMVRTIGTIHQTLARRMEVALLIANDERATIGIIDDASAVAATLGAASYLKADERRRLFDVEYPLHWRDEPVVPHALVTGLMQIDEDLRHATLSLMIFSADNHDLREIGEDRIVKVDASWLPEIGESYSLTRGAFDGGSISKTNGTSSPDDLPDDLPDDADPGAISDQSLISAVNVRDESASHPLNDSNAAVRVQVYYDGRPISPEFKDGVARIAEPRAGQRVEIEVQKDSSSTRYGVCVKVNGESTLNRMRLPDLNCRKWILSRPKQRIVLKGYQISNSEIEEFRVLTDQESNDRELDYGKDVGTITISVFPEGTTEQPQSREERELDLIASTKLPKEKLGSFAKLKGSLLGSANRGIIVEGRVSAGRINSRSFKTTATPVMSTTIRYYKP